MYSKVKNCAAKETFQRINYLYQIANTPVTGGVPSAKARATMMYAHLLIGVAKKSVQKMEPEVKRSICKGCHGLLVAGESARVRIKKKSIVWTCLRCGNKKPFYAAQNYGLWIEDPAATIELLRY